MDECVYNPTTKQVYLKFDRSYIVVDVEDFMNILYCLEDAKALIEKDPDIGLAEYTDDEGNLWKEFFVNSKDENYN
jgi:hypothetical protein